MKYLESFAFFPETEKHYSMQFFLDFVCVCCWMGEYLFRVFLSYASYDCYLYATNALTNIICII